MVADVVKQIEKFKEFLETNYEKKITNALAKGEKALVVDFSELSSFDPEIGEQLLDEPEETLKAMNIALERFEAPKSFKVRFKNLPESQKLDIRNIRAEHLNKFITIEGIIRQTSDVRPQVISTRFECPSCGNTITIPQLGEQFKEPSRCSCGRKGKFRLLSKDLIDAQRVTIEESPDALKGGAQPKRLHIFLREDLVDPKFERKTTPGSRVLAVGTVNEIPIPLKTGAMSTRFDLAMNANYVDLVEEDFADIEINKEDEEMIKLLAKDPKIYEKLTESIAPSILGHEKVKEALMLQLFGGVRKNKEDGTIARGDFHVLLVGDPGCGKSAMLTFISKAAPKARYAAGKGVSSAGLTASVVKDDFLRGWALEAGAMVLANKGVFVLDEMDKISKEDTSALHEAMEQQSYHPETVLTFADGSTAKIGDFVDSLFEKNKDIVVNGKDCEILPVDDVELLSTDFNNIKSVYANRVSRHVAPSYFVEVTFSHGRKIIVTPEHPIFVYNNGSFGTVDAEQLKAGAFAPAPKEKPTKGKCIKRVKVKSVRKIPNNGIKWVYDVTVEPDHTFISEGLVLHNTVTIMKANIHATLKAETSVLSAANPKLGRFDPYGPPIAAQIDLPPALINRFDLIFVMKDIPDRIKDKKIARHVLGIHKTSKNPTSVFPTDLLRKYIAYAKQNIVPQLTDEAIDEMEEFYVSLRNTGTSGERVRPIPISARQIEAMVRLATASAKSRLSDKITVSDARRAIELITYSMHEVGIDPETGKLDIDIIATGMSSSTRGRIHSVRDIIFDMDASGRKQVPVEEVVKSALEKGMKEQEIEEAIEKLKRNGDVFEPKKGFLQKI